jgi:hypothetical protein
MARPKCSTTGKDRFPNEMESNLAIASLTLASKHHRRQKYRELPTRSYQCEFCHGWHMTSQAKNEEWPDRKSLTG